MRPFLMALLSTLLLALPALSPAAAPPRPVLTRVVGDVTVKPAGGGWVKAAEGMALGGGDTVKTGAASRAEIAFFSGAMRLFENTLVMIPDLMARGEARDVGRLDLEGGGAAFRIDPAAAAGGFSVKTRHVIAGVKGTRFSLATTPDKTEVVVYFGLVVVTDPAGGKGVELGTNQALSADGSGPGRPRSLPTGDGWSGWSDGSSPLSADPGAVSQGGEAGGESDRGREK